MRVRFLLFLSLLVICAAAQAQFSYFIRDGKVTITKCVCSDGAVTIPSSIEGLPVTSVGNSDYWPFAGCTVVKSVTIPSSVTTIGRNAFYDCSSLTNITIPGSITNIGGGAFQKCSSLTSISLPSGITRIPADMLYACSNLVSVKVPSNIVSIGDEAFQFCRNLTSVEIPSGVTNIGYYAFLGCASLKSITIPRSVVSIGDSAFHSCSALALLDVAEDNANYSSLDGVLFDKNLNTLIQCPGGKVGSYSIPSTVTNVVSGALQNCPGLVSVAIPSGVSRIGDVGCSCFLFTGCSSLRTLTVDADNPSYSSLHGVLFDKSQATLIQCPEGRTGSYTIPSSVINIGTGAFYGCSSLTNIIIPGSVRTIRSWAFEGCTSLGSVTISEGVASIQNRAFKSCTSLASVTIPSSAREFDYETFSDCTSLVSLTILDGVSNLGDTAFKGCTSLTSVTIPSSVTMIGLRVFDGCTHLANVTIGKGVTRIGQEAFSRCPNLVGLYFEGFPPDINPRAFSGSEAFIFFHRPEVLFWPLPFNYRPRALWIPPPSYAEWVKTSLLLNRYPDASGEADDPDRDGMRNYDEMLAGTDPTDRNSLLSMQQLPRPNDLTAEDKSPINQNQHAWYFSSVPGKSYGVQMSSGLFPAWVTRAIVTATTTQTRLVFEKPGPGAGRNPFYYRVILAQ